MNRRNFLKFFGLGLAASVATRAAHARVCENNIGTVRAIYPVGAVYISTINTNPASLFGFGTWTRTGNGRALVGVDETDGDFNTVQRTGGAKNHTLSIAELPSHRHDGVVASGRTATASGTGNSRPLNAQDIGNTGGGQAHNNMQPYIAVFIWRRTS